MIVIHSKSTDVYENLAVEDVLLDDATLTEPVVFIYRNDDAVVIGKNQNPWRECAVSRLDELGVKLARRVSGGGAVYHDPGNLNISCIVPRERYQRCEMLKLFIRGLAGIDVSARIENSTSLVAGEKKISGNAFCYRRDKVLHHGTFLCEANLEKLRAALVPDLPEMETRAVASVPMPVMNLGERAKGDVLVKAIIDALSTEWGTAKAPEQVPFRREDIAARVERMRSWEWLYGTTPDFSVRRDGRVVTVHRGLGDNGERF